MAYPKETEQQLMWWQGQLTFARQRMQPLFDASAVLAKQFYNVASTEREEEQEDFGMDQEEHIGRTRSSIIYGWIDQSLSNMLDRSPVFQCLPETREAAQRIDPADPNSPTFARGTSKIVNYRYRETNQLRVDERVAQDAFIYPYGVAKIGYTLDFEKRFQDLMQPEDINLVFDDPEEENAFLMIGEETRVTELQDHRGHIQAHVVALQGGMLRFEELQVRQAMATLETHIDLHKVYLERRAPAANTNIKYEAPFAVRWPPDMFLTDSLCLEGPNDARWIAFEWVLPLEEVQADPSYENTSDLEPSRLDGSPDKPNDLDSDGFDMVRGWEIWAKNFPVGKNKFEDKLIVMAEGHDKFLRNEDEWPYSNLDDYPVETLVYNPGLESWFHKAPLLMGGGDTVQGLVNEVLDSYLSTVRKQKNLWLVDPSTGIDENTLTDILEAPDGSVVQVPGLIESGGKGIIPLPFQQVPPEKGEILRILQSMFDRSMGTPQPVAMPQSDSATEANIMDKRNTSRENRRSGLLGEFQTRKARKMWQLDTQYQPDRLFLLERNADKFISITAEMARGEYLFSMDVTSHTTAMNVERSQWMDLLNLFAGLTPIMMQTFGAPPNLPELARRLLVRGFDERVVEEILPMLETVAKTMDPAQQAQQAGPEQSGGVEGQGSGTEFADPAAEGAQTAVKDGRMVDKNIGPLDRDTFNRAPAEAAKLEGAALR